MTTIGVKYHNEDIHDIIRKPMSPTVKSPRYKSKISSSIEISPLKKAGKKYNGHQTFGLAHYEPPEAKSFLKKGTGKPPGKVINKQEFKCTIGRKHSPVPKYTAEKRKQARKNFVKENIKKIATLQPKEHVPKRVETPRGTVKDMAHLIQMIKIRQSEEYGKIPKYLYVRKKKEEKRRKEQELEEQALKELNEKMGVGNMETTENVYMIDSETRQQILNGLKENWNELSKQFLKLPVMTDTWPKIKRKMWLEREIEQLEKDIRLVESHPYIYLEKPVGRSQEVVTEKTSEINTTNQKPETEVTEEKLEKEENEQTIEVSTEDKKEEDTEINILNY